jgi:16S rRNA A1518/A1519 N6-dimethyltransferase RsmA/KsgA/DIM1 with predicted DNA glycosylase/AP lyase activity
MKYVSFNFNCKIIYLGKIVAVGSSPATDTAVIEIGPAAGNLTRALLSRGHSKILVIEKDLRFKPILEVNINTC